MACPPGMVSTGGAVACSVCPWNTTARANTCTACPNGTFTTSQAASACSSCNDDDAPAAFCPKTAVVPPPLTSAPPPPVPPAPLEHTVHKHFAACCSVDALIIVSKQVNLLLTSDRFLSYCFLSSLSEQHCARAVAATAAVARGICQMKRRKRKKRSSNVEYLHLPVS